MKAANEESGGNPQTPRQARDRRWRQTAAQALQIAEPTRFRFT